MVMSKTFDEPHSGPRAALGATYEGRDPALLERMLPLVDYIEVTLETISEVKDDKVALSVEVMSELKNIGKEVKIIVHGVSLSIGSHEGWAYQGDLFGEVDGNHVRLHSSLPADGNRLSYTFTGTLSGNEMSGGVEIGEYGAARWRARRHAVSA